MYFPPQLASGAHCENIAEDAQALRSGTIGAVHSHVRMNAFFSGTDTRHANWPVEIVVNAKGEMSSRVRFRLECGRYTRLETRLLLSVSSPTEHLAAQLKRALAEGDALVQRRRETENAARVAEATRRAESAPPNDDRGASGLGEALEQTHLQALADWQNKCWKGWSEVG